MMKLKIWRLILTRTEKTIEEGWTIKVLKAKKSELTLMGTKRSSMSWTTKALKERKSESTLMGAKKS
jgi:hypothetical protein